MQKLTLIFIFLISFITAITQKKDKYKYSYDFSVTISSACSASFLQDSSINSTQQPLLEIELKDCFNNAVPFATFTLKKIDSSLIQRVFDDKGKISIRLIPGEYVLTISSVGSESFTKKISLTQSDNQHFKITMQASTLKDYYTVSSRIKLTEKDIDKIKLCIIKAKGIAYKCSERKIYVISTWM